LDLKRIEEIMAHKLEHKHRPKTELKILEKQFVLLNM